MSMRLNYFDISPKAIQILMNLEEYLKNQFIRSNTVPIITWELVKLRISQINQCAFCTDMHGKELVKLNVDMQRIIGLSAWGEMPYYSETERAALLLAEKLTCEGDIDSDNFSRIAGCLGEREMVDLAVAINAVNSWNRIAKTFQLEVGSYEPG